ncbi:hypothetical protein E6R61_05695 [Streptomyces sp. LRa12]|uniref:hypothetical protein n=1 Tax=Streptomyces sp. LRa12 TaxID=2563107 RepID=UPI00109EB59E|nr:hypothetical protein [Streptomyces sp. LRa12]THA98838.1 hypothetical protein E6R61_05695 [Streptomyces sp. LRa12]
MTEPSRYPESPVVLPLDEWLYEAHPVAGCSTCSAAATALETAKKSGDANARFEAARIVRQHPHETRVSA